MNESKLNSDETIIYDILKEYLKKKSFHPGLDIVDYLNNRLKSNPDFNRNKIELIIKSLTEKKIIVPGTKLIKEDVLEIPLRRKIYRHINRNPGVNVYEIRKDLNIGSNQATWHLKKLEQFQFIKSAKIGNKKAELFPYLSMLATKWPL